MAIIESLALATLHSGGLTHKDLKSLFSGSENYHEVLTQFLVGGWVPTPWITTERKSKILTKMKQVDTQKIAEIIEKKKITLIPQSSPLYPEKLKTIKQSPYFLYVRGDLHDARKMIGIVGSRKSTSYGKKVLENIIPELVAAECGIVSGGAYGIDALSHQLALVHGGYTLSVFGCGVDVSYPAQNNALFESILSSGGALVSIFPISTRPEPFYFPIRNEVVAALSDGILIPEAGVKSGTLITAGLALEHGRDVFAVPGDIFRETSMGTNGLIARGEAKCTQSAQEILEEYFPNRTPGAISLLDKKSWDSEEQKKIYESIEQGYNTPDSIGENTQYSIDTIIMNLSLMEMEGYIRLGPNGRYEVI